MTARLPRLLVVAVLVTLLAGCGGGGLFGALLGLVAVGNVIGELGNLIGGDDPDEFDVYLDGQLLPEHPDGGGNLHLRGLPEGRHLLQIIAPSRYRGAVSLITVDPDTDLPLNNLQHQVGGRIRGTVTVQETGGATRAAARVPVYAIPGGAQAASIGAPIVQVPPDGTYYVMYTDGNGQFSLDAGATGDYLVTAVVAGCDADARLVQGLGERQTLRDMDLTRVADGVATGIVRGAANEQVAGGTQSLAGASLRAGLQLGLLPDVPQATIDRIAAASGVALRPSPWFQWHVLSTLSDAGGTYVLDLPAGNSRITCFAYDHQPGYRDAVVVNAADLRVDFTLQPR